MALSYFIECVDKFASWVCSMFSSLSCFGPHRSLASVVVYILVEAHDSFSSINLCFCFIQVRVLVQSHLLSGSSVISRQESLELFSKLDTEI